MVTICNGCGERKPPEAFGSRPGWCRVCVAAYARARREGQDVRDVRRQHERDLARRAIGLAMVGAAGDRLAASPLNGGTVTVDAVATALYVDVDVVHDLVAHRRLPRPRRNGGIPRDALLRVLRDT